MKIDISILVERTVPDAEGCGYHADDPPVTFATEADGQIVCISCGKGADVWRVHLSDFLDVAEKLNGATKYRTDFSPFNLPD